MVSTSRTILAASIALFSAQVNAFATSSSAVRLQRSGSEMHMIDVSSICGMADTLPALGSSPGLLIAETDAWVQPTALLLGPFLNFLSLAMLCRVVASWYPETDLNKFPWIIVAWPTDPLLKLAKGSIPPAFGVDITPVFWLAIFTFINEILLGPQGLLVMKMKYGI